MLTTEEKKELTVLIVDDEPKNIQLLGSILSSEGFQVEYATNGTDAIEWCETEHFDTILLDIMMPGMNGFEVCEKLKGNPRTAQIPIIFLTAKADPASIIEGFEIGAMDFITKPFNKMELLVRVQTQLKLSLNQTRMLSLNGILESTISDLATKNEQLKSTQAKLIQSEKMGALGVLVAGVAHEINNPANFISVSGENLKKRIVECEEFIFQLAGKDSAQKVNDAISEKFAPLYENAGSVIEGALRIKSIVGNLKTFSHLDDVKMKKVSILENIRSTVSLVQTNFKENIKFQFDLQDDPVIECFPDHLEQVFVNLAINACHAIDKKSETASKDFAGQLTISTKIQSDYLAITFEDNGIGMTDEVRKNIFDPFYTTKPVGEGTGLGLSISFGIVDRHNGKIEVTTEPGKGTSFCILLPLKKIK